ncbi:FAD/NAD(P)-binding protein [Nocardioides sp. zg-578]|nr:FAD/NAD(P)-binding protein [Nocardioides marmotae]MTB84141.1 SidA/IucD/PvdA family monooxygenase [Nocardioides marmotae]
MRLVVVGAGAAGSLVLLHLARHLAAGSEGSRVEVVVLDPNGPVNGAAFCTTDPRHLLNVPASGMSVDPEDRFDFVAHLVAEGLLAEGASPYFFAPRAEWARYLRTRLDEALVAVEGRLVVRHVLAAATSVARDGAGVRVTDSDGSTHEADHLVLATGLPTVGDDWAPRDLSAQERYVADPWRPGALDAVVDGEGDVLVVGTGLTMVDVAVSVVASSATGRRVAALSRAGRLPQPHAESYLGEVVPDVSGWGSTLEEIRGAAVAHVREVEATQGSWRPAVDGIRYRVAELWGRLATGERERFLREVAGDWGVRRHRMPPTTAAVVEQAQEDGCLEVAAGRVVAVEEAADGFEVETADGRRIHAAWIVNCTGPRSDVRTLGNPVLDSLLGADGGPALATTDPLGLGLTTSEGRLVGPDGELQPVWTLGALRRGELWESTAIPEIRVQAERLAGDLAAVAAWSAGQAAGQAAGPSIDGAAASTTASTAGSMKKLSRNSPVGS